MPVGCRVLLDIYRRFFHRSMVVVLDRSAGGRWGVTAGREGVCCTSRVDSHHHLKYGDNLSSVSKGVIFCAVRQPECYLSQQDARKHPPRRGEPPRGAGEE